MVLAFLIEVYTMFFRFYIPSPPDIVVESIMFSDIMHYVFCPSTVSVIPKYIFLTTKA